MGSFEGEARLLVYDEAEITGSMIGDDVRAVLDHRPNTPRIYVLAPFQPFGEVLSAMKDGIALRRAGAFGCGEELAAVGLDLVEGQPAVVSRPFSVGTDGQAIEGPPVPLPQELREGWLFDLFDTSKARVDAPAGVHFGKASHKHSDRFLRTSSVLLSTAACGVLGFFALAALGSREPRRIFVDTAPLLSVAFAMHRVALTLKLWQSMPPAKSFSSYGGVDRLPRLGAGDLFLLSASTSGGLARELEEAGAAARMLLTFYLLKSAHSTSSPGEVLCDLTWRPERTFGYPLINNYAPDACVLCKRGYVLAELEGDQFLLERRSVKRLRFVAVSQAPEARSAFELLAKRKVFTVRLHARETWRSDVGISVEDILNDSTKVGRDFQRLLIRHLPMPLTYVVLVGISRETFSSLLQAAGLVEICQSALVVISEDVASLEPRFRANALIVIGLLDDHAVLRSINAQMRSKAPGGCVAYLSAVTVAESARNREDLRIFLSYGEHGPDTFTFRSAMNIMLPWTGDRVSPWSEELNLLRNLAAATALPELLVRRQQWLESTAEASQCIFLAGLKGELALAVDFVFLDTTKSIELISQADVYAVVANLLATERSNGKGLNEPVRRDSQQLAWVQTVYAQVLLCPSNFRDFNDGILKASMLRAASPSELNYSVDALCSKEMLDVVLAEVDDWAKGGGDALPEFLLSLACGRLKLAKSHEARLLQELAKADLPDHLKPLVKCLGIQAHW